jgi:hypothetical protein
MLRRAGRLLVAVVVSGLGVGALGAAGASADGVRYVQIANLTGPGVPAGPPFGLVSDIVFVDPVSHRVLLADDSNTFGGITGQVDAWDTLSNVFVGGMSGGFTGITGFPGSFDQLGPDGVLVDDQGQIWAGNGDGTVKAGTISNMSEIASVTTGSAHRADELAYDPVDHEILVTNPSDSPPFVTVISDPAGGPFGVRAHIGLGKKVPLDSIEQPKYDPITGRFLVSVRQVFAGDTQGEVAAINPVTLKAERPIRLTVNCNPAGMALGPGRDVLLGCDSFPPVIIDRVTGALEPISFGSFPATCCADEVWFNPGDGRYYAAEFGNPNGTGSNPVVTVIDGQTRQVLAEIPIRNSSGQPDPAFHAVAADPNTNHVYVPTSQGVQVFRATGS